MALDTLSNLLELDEELAVLLSPRCSGGARLLSLDWPDEEAMAEGARVGEGKREVLAVVVETEQRSAAGSAPRRVPKRSQARADCEGPLRLRLELTRGLLTSNSLAHRL